jgi:hypothetical protein
MLYGKLCRFACKARTLLVFVGKLPYLSVMAMRHVYVGQRGHERRITAGLLCKGQAPAMASTVQRVRYCVRDGLQFYAQPGWEDEAKPERCDYTGEEHVKALPLVRKELAPGFPPLEYCATLQANRLREQGRRRMVDWSNARDAR